MFVHRGVCLCAEVDRVAGPAVTGTKILDPTFELGREHGHLQAVALASVDSEDRQPARITEHRHPQAVAQWLGADHLGDVKELLDGVHSYHPGPLEQGGHGLVQLASAAVETAGPVLSTPKQFGPTMRMP